MLDPRIAAGKTYTDESHKDTFTIDTVHEDERVAELDNGQWYELDGPDGLIDKLNHGVVREVK